MCLGASPSHSPAIGRILNLRTGVTSPVMRHELLSATQGSLAAAVFDLTTRTKLLGLNGLELTLDPADVCCVCKCCWG